MTSPINTQAEPTATPSTENESNLGYMTRRFGWLGALAVIGVWFVMVACLLASFHPAFELFTHMSLHLFFICCLLLPLLLFRFVWQIQVKGTRRLRLIQLLLLLIPTMYFAYRTKPWIIWQKPKYDASSVPADETIRVFSWNIWLENFRGKDVLEVVKGCDSDIVVLIEVNIATALDLEPLRTSNEYADVYWAPAWNSTGVIILSRVPGTTFSEVNLQAAGTEGIDVFVPGDDSRAPFHLLAVHTRSPTTFQRSIERDQQFETIADWAREQIQPAAIIGDLNVTPWSPAYDNLIIQGELGDSRFGFGNCASWPSLLGRFGIPIDHVLTNRMCRVIERAVFATAPGSDHRPVRAVLQLTDAPQSLTNQKGDDSSQPADKTSAEPNRDIDL